ncbi:ABC transporter ATP-binding protein [Paenibacillus sp. GCM10027626]|uniref:ABC transporter ATP-binding protein n=1 Tax=Paenibacillus sp. GCM10027626 TaxID=3273411 RepID=UPI0036278968
MSEPLLQVKGLYKHYPVPRKSLLAKRSYVKAVNDVTFEIEKGEIFGLVGESGCGKSTLGQLLVQLHPLTGGSLTFQGQDITHVKGKEQKALRRSIQMIFQDPFSSLNPKKKIRAILEEPLLIHGIGDKADRLAAVKEMLSHVGLNDSYLERYPHELSGGQRQRIGIACALILRPEFIVADEALSALDVSVQAQILNLLVELQQKFQLTMLFISHDLNVVQYISSRVGVMYLGELMEIAAAEQFGEKPLHPYSQALLYSAPDMERQERANPYLIRGEVPSPVDLPSGCAFHNRCPFATALCKKVKPLLQQVADNHFVRCHQAF